MKFGDSVTETRQEKSCEELEKLISYNLVNLGGLISDFISLGRVRERIEFLTASKPGIYLSISHEYEDVRLRSEEICEIRSGILKALEELESLVKELRSSQKPFKLNLNWEDIKKSIQMARNILIVVCHYRYDSVPFSDLSILESQKS